MSRFPSLQFLFRHFWVSNYLHLVLEESFHISNQRCVAMKSPNSMLHYWPYQVKLHGESGLLKRFLAWLSDGCMLGC